MRRMSRRTLGIAALAISLGVSSLGGMLPAQPAHASTLASVSAQGDGPATPLDQYNARLANLEQLVQSGDCATARSEIRSLLTASPESLFRSDATLGQMRGLGTQMDEVLRRAANRC